MKKVIIAAMFCGILVAVFAAGSISDYFSDGMMIGIFTVAVLAAGSAIAVRRDRNRHAWH